MSNRFAGVTYDWYDDQGLTLKSKFPTRESLPEIIKTATIHPKDRLANEQFALVMIDGGGVFRKYACNDAGTTAMSAIYFMEHGDKLPEEAQKVAASNLTDALLRHGIRPPALMVKVARTALVKRLLSGALPQTTKAMPEMLHAARATQRAGQMMGATERAVQKLGPQAVLNPSTAKKVDELTQMARNIGTRGKRTMQQMTGALQSPAAGAGARRLGARQQFRQTMFPKTGALQKYANGDKDEPMDEGAPPSEEQRQKIRQFIINNDNLSDDEFHAFVERMGVNPHFAEAVVYDMAHELSKGAAADMIPGGKADDKTDSDFSSRQMTMGQKVEMEHTDDPKKAREISRDHLEEFPDYYTRLHKMETAADKAKEGSNLVDITGQRPPVKVKKAAPISDDDYAVITPEGRRLYPIHTWDLIKTAEQYWTENRRLMAPEIRRQFATKLATKATQVGYPIDLDIFEAGSPTYASDGYLGTAIEMRKVACAPDSDERDFLDGLFEKRAEIDPNIYAEVLRRFDVERGLDSGWDHVIPDPWSSTFGIDKTANVVWEDGADRVTDKALVNLAENHTDVVTKEFTDDMAHEFKKDPVAVFKSMPTPHKKILARMAMDSESQGESEAAFTR